ncbi:MAG: hypothetical protein M3Q77_06945 [Thermoproteota archaeon]|nr:hypothetical protein [Nitrosopumilus sp.]MDQ3084537.1 hypothetical protein [Thermoproteota archaeon]
MITYSTQVIDCLAAWTQKLQKCNGDPECIRQSGQELRKSLDDVFPPSNKLEFDNDKINYIFSSIFFLSNRLSKALIGLAETDNAINKLVAKERQTVKNTFEDKDIKEFQTILDQILSDHY